MFLGEKGNKIKPTTITAVKIGKTSSLMKKHNMDKRHSMKSQQKPNVVKRKDKARGPLKNHISYDPRVPLIEITFWILSWISWNTNWQSLCVLQETLSSATVKMMVLTMGESETNKQTDSFFQKVKLFVHNGKTSHAAFFNKLQISDEEKAVIECSTRDQRDFWKF